MLKKEKEKHTPHKYCTKNGKLVFPPVTPLLIHTKAAAGIYFLPKHTIPHYIKVCMSETDLSEGLESHIYNRFSYLSCNGVRQATCDPYPSQVERKSVTIQPQAWTCPCEALLVSGRLGREDHTAELISVFQQDWNKQITLNSKNSLWVSSTREDKYLSYHYKCYMIVNKMQGITAFFITALWNCHWVSQS